MEGFRDTSLSDTQGAVSRTNKAQAGGGYVLEKGSVEEAVKHQFS